MKRKPFVLLSIKRLNSLRDTRYKKSFTKTFDLLFSNSYVIHEPNLQTDYWVWVMCIEFDTQCNTVHRVFIWHQWNVWFIVLKLVHYSWTQLPDILLELGHVYRVWYSLEHCTSCFHLASDWRGRVMLSAWAFISSGVPDEGTIRSEEGHCGKWGNTAFRKSVSQEILLRWMT